MMRRFVHFSACVCLILTVCLNDWAQKPELVVRTGHSGGVTSVAISPDGTTLASGSRDNTIKLWDVATGRELRTLKGHSNSDNSVGFTVESVAFSPDGKI